MPRQPLWFTLADVFASKILTGDTPKVLQAIRFEPKEKQDGLRPIKVAGQTIDPAEDDFYQRLIIHRNSIKARRKGPSDAEKPALKIVLNHAAAGQAAIVIHVRERAPSGVTLAHDIGLASLALGVERIKLLLEPIIGRLTNGRMV